MRRRTGSMMRMYHRPRRPCARTYTASRGRPPASERCRKAETVRLSIRWSCSSGSTYTGVNPVLPRSRPRRRPSAQRSANRARVGGALALVAPGVHPPGQRRPGRQCRVHFPQIMEGESLGARERVHAPGPSQMVSGVKWAWARHVAFSVLRRAVAERAAGAYLQFREELALISLLRAHETCADGRPASAPRRETLPDEDRLVLDTHLTPRAAPSARPGGGGRWIEAITPAS